MSAVKNTSGRIPLMAGNWKMNLNHIEAISLVQKLAFTLNDKDFDRVEVAVLPPFTDLRSVQTMVEADKLRFTFGAQDISQHAGGAYTGEIAGSMLAKLNCTYALVGHSERRQYHHEDDALVNAKAHAAYASGLVPIVCVGEGLDVRKAGEHVAYTLAQVEGALKGITPEQAESVVIAYEPVWAIGTGEVATPENAQEVCAAIRGRLAELYSADLADRVRVLYGGSMKPNNVAGLMAQADVDGGLVGGACLLAEDFARIVRYQEQ
ncbi:triose-phosphate isomerase [Embleya scabrispora]|uniref:Triosephosphate isomerase n=1 Tax=Embleya scabrispora TaxID=159449 RepID=A0A1T3P310_9ACTN|nr:triose-phosphate isomerase [Embleya scabrispora]OPC83384.1 triose-phosphate isomerase [Embleya scabrispora]